MRCDAPGAESVQDRPFEAGGARSRRIGVQRIAIATQPIEQGLLRQRRNIDDGIGLSGRHRNGRRRRRIAGNLRRREAAVAAREGGVRHRRQQRVAVGVVQGLVVGDRCAAAKPFVDDPHDAMPRADSPRRRQRPVPDHPLLTMDDLREIDSGGWVLHPGTGKTEHHGHRGQRKRGVGHVVHELQLLRIGRVAAQAECQRVAQRVVGVVALHDFVEAPRLQSVEIDHSVHLGAGNLHHLAPLLDLGGHEAAEVRRCVPARGETLRFEFVLHVG